MTGLDLFHLVHQALKVMPEPATIKKGERLQRLCAAFKEEQMNIDTATHVLFSK